MSGESLRRRGYNQSALLADELEKDYYRKLEAFLTEEYAN